MFAYNFKILCSRSVKSAIGILIGIALNLQIALANHIYKETLSYDTKRI